MKNKYSLFLILILALSALSNKLHASHYGIGDIRYEYIGDSTGVALTKIMEQFLQTRLALR